MASPPCTAAQADTLGTGERAPYRLDDVTVVAHRTPTVLRESAAAVTVLTRDMLERLPARTLGEALAFAPGLLFLDRDGAGQLPMPVARGFFGGGETDYVLVTLDGVPLNDLRTGAVQWSLLPLASIDRVEVLRGGGSSVHGDAALGAVVNVVSRRSSPGAGFDGHLGVGDWGARHLVVSGGGPLGPGVLDAGAAYSRVGGFRSHAASTDASATVSYRGAGGRTVELHGRAQLRRMEKDEPGALPLEEAARDPKASHPLFGDDRRSRTEGDLAVGASARLPGGSRLDANAGLRLLDESETRTLLLTPGFGDTQRREETNAGVWTRLQGSFALGAASLVTGVETEYGEYDTEYLEPAGAPLNRGAGGRLKLGAYGELRRPLGSRWNVYVGARFDHLTLDRHGAGSGSAARFSRLSPRVGVNFAYLKSERGPGNLYASWAQAFKAPTLDQLYGARRIPTGQPGESISFSNEELRPQRSEGVELGLLQRFPLGSGHAEVTLAVYRLDVDDEIDFDVATFRFGNIQRSRHDGLEASVYAAPARAVSVHHALTLGRVVFRGGENAGNDLKNIPRSSLASALRLSPVSDVHATLTHRFTSRLYLDDANRTEIPGHHTFGLEAGWEIGRARLTLSGNNLFDVRASGVGFTLFDPASGGEVPFVYPIGGRSIALGIALSS